MLKSRLTYFFSLPIYVFILHKHLGVNMGFAIFSLFKIFIYVMIILIVYNKPVLEITFLK